MKLIIEVIKLKIAIKKPKIVEIKPNFLNKKFRILSKVVISIYKKLKWIRIIPKVKKTNPNMKISVSEWFFINDNK